MLNLMKYEFLRRKRLLMTVLIIFVCIEVAIYAGLNLGGDWYIMSVLLMMITLIGGLLFPFIDTVTNYYSDFKNKNGYMLYLTPNSGGKIIGAKAAFAFIELLISVLLIWAVSAINLGLLERLHPEIVTPVLNEIAIEFQEVLNIENFTVFTLSPLALLAMLQYFANAMIAVLAITIAKTILSNKDFNWLFAVIFYFAVSTLMSSVNVGVLASAGFAKNFVDVINTGSEVISNVVKMFSILGVLYMLWSAASITISSILLNKRTDL